MLLKAPLFRAPATKKVARLYILYFLGSAMPIHEGYNMVIAMQNGFRMIKWVANINNLEKKRPDRQISQKLV